MKLKIEHVDRAIMLAVAEAVTREGHWPDVKQFLPGNDVAGFQAAKDAIVASGKELVEVFGVGAFRGRGDLKQNNVIIRRMDVGEGTHASGAPIRLEKYAGPQGEELYRKVRTADGPESLNFEIRFVCYDVAMERVIMQIMRSALPRRGWLNGRQEDLTRTLAGFWVMQQGPAVDMSDNDFIERIWRFVAVDVELGGDIVLKENIQPIKEVVLEVAPAAKEETPAGAAAAAGPVMDALTGVLVF